MKMNENYEFYYVVYISKNLGVVNVENFWTHVKQK